MNKIKSRKKMRVAKLVKKAYLIIGFIFAAIGFACGMGAVSDLVPSYASLPNANTLFVIAVIAMAIGGYMIWDYVKTEDCYDEWY